MRYGPVEVKEIVYTLGQAQHAAKNKKEQRELVARLMSQGMKSNRYTIYFSRTEAEFLFKSIMGIEREIE